MGTVCVVIHSDAAVPACTVSVHKPEVYQHTVSCHNKIIRLVLYFLAFKKRK